MPVYSKLLSAGALVALVVSGSAKNTNLRANYDGSAKHLLFLENTNFAAAAAKQCENQCKPGGTYRTAGSPNAACTAAYCDRYSPGKIWASRCIPGNLGHKYAQSECQSTCKICPNQLAIDREIYSEKFLKLEARMWRMEMMWTRNFRDWLLKK